MRFRFGKYALDIERRELHRGADVVDIEPQVFDLLVHLIRNRDRVVSKDDLLAAIWHGRVVSESTLTSRITAARHAVGDSGKQQQFIRTVPRRGIRFVGEVREERDQSALAHGANSSILGRPGVFEPKPHQDVTFCKAEDGVNLAIASVGEGQALVKTANWLNHIEYGWQSPVWSPLLMRLAEQFCLIRYDERGNGLSDWRVGDLSFEAFVRDLEAVVDTLRLERFSL